MKIENNDNRNLVDVFAMSTKLRRLLLNAGIKTIKGLMSHSVKDLMMIKGFGWGSLRVLEIELVKHDLELRMI